jgi:Putative transposase
MAPLRRRPVLPVLLGGQRRETIERAHDCADHVGGHLRLQRSGVDLGMSEQNLDQTHLGVLLEKVGGNGANAELGISATAFATHPFKAHLKPLREIDWVVYAKEPFAGPRQVLRYLSRYTRRIAVSNRRLVSANESGVIFRTRTIGSKGRPATRP